MLVMGPQRFQPEELPLLCITPSADMIMCGDYATEMSCMMRNIQKCHQARPYIYIAHATGAAVDILLQNWVNDLASCNPLDRLNYWINSVVKSFRSLICPASPECRVWLSVSDTFWNGDDVVTSDHRNDVRLTSWHVNGPIPSIP